MKFIKTILFLFLSVIIISCGEDGLSDLEIPEPSRNSKLTVTVELCESNDCQPLQGKIVNIYQFEDEAMGFQEGIKIAQTDTSGVAGFGLVELESVFVTVRQDGILDISLVSLPRNSLSHHLVTFVK